jgi:hypothetical protein
MSSLCATLISPTGPEEMELLAASGYRRWPPRLPGQQIFYPVLNEEYATQIARDWNVPRGGGGYVTKFRVRRSFLDRYEVQQVGGRTNPRVLDPGGRSRCLQRQHCWRRRSNCRVSGLRTIGSTLVQPYQFGRNLRIRVLRWCRPPRPSGAHARSRCLKTSSSKMSLTPSGRLSRRPSPTDDRHP